MSRYVLGIDQGTTGSTVVVVGEDMRILARGYREFPQIFPETGWVEHAPEAIWQSVLAALSQAVSESGIDPNDIAAIGITNQRETTVCVDLKGNLLYNAIVWQDRRTAHICQELVDTGKGEILRHRTGLVVDPYFSATKMRWLMESVPLIGRMAGMGEIRFGTIDTFLLYRLSGGAVWITDPSNASRTLLFNLRERRFDEQLCDLVGVPSVFLPTVVPSQGTCCTTRNVPGLPDGIPITAIAGDQQAALFGQMCHEPGDAKCTFGTGAFLLMNVGKDVVTSKHGLLSTVAWQMSKPRHEFVYALEGSAFVAGALVQWLRDELGIISTASEIESLARSVPDSGGVMIVPALTGLGAPHWRPAARGLIAGVTRGTKKAHLARAALEGIALQNCDLLSAMSTDSGVTLRSLRVDGGASQNDLLMQIQADFLGVDIIRSKWVESTALGAAFMAGLSVDVWTDLEQLHARYEVDRVFSPKRPQTAVKVLLDRWRELVSCA